MRKYPVAPVIFRVCNDPYRIPSTDATIDTDGTFVIIPLWCLHRDPELFPEPEKFDPERFSEENKHKVVPGSYMPFGDGPKVCIGKSKMEFSFKLHNNNLGLRFALMKMKMCLTALLKDFEFRLDAKTKTVLEFDYGFFTNIKGSIWINSRKASNEI